MALVDMALWGLAGWILRGESAIRTRPNLTEEGDGRGTGLQPGTRTAGRGRDGRDTGWTLRLTGRRQGWRQEDRATDSACNRARVSCGSSRRLYWKYEVFPLWVVLPKNWK
ncbi:hypothetical protein B0H65DRAFT_90445 [Neurospora tetraspora]|uniref:Uncharacterized protein n=1 Tax=Neurospora tetraspora TaxID=94610 RepID=A0AAE0MTL2_9PEZI|nr:hypothetical protein B0H65DRAFT_90445 [Neurospora tetraspora]